MNKQVVVVCIASSSSSFTSIGGVRVSIPVGIPRRSRLLLVSVCVFIYLAQTSLIVFHRSEWQKVAKWNSAGQTTFARLEVFEREKVESSGGFIAPPTS